MTRRCVSRFMIAARARDAYKRSYGIPIPCSVTGVTGARFLQLAVNLKTGV